MRLRSRPSDQAGGGGEVPTPSRRRWPYALGTVVLVVAVTAGAFLARRGDGAGDEAAAASPRASEQVVEVTSGSISETVAAEGTIEPETTSDLAFGSAGTVTSVTVAVGDTVAAGDPLATIDSAELEAELADARASADEAVADLSGADGDATDAERAALEARVDTANLALIEAQQALDGATLVAPVAGTVTVVDYAEGDVLGSSGADGSAQSGSGTPSGATAIPSSGDDAQGGSTTTGIQVVSTGTYTVSIDVSATEIAQVEVGQEALVTPTTSSSSSSGGGFGPGAGGFPGGGMPPGMVDGGSSDGGSSDGATASGDQVSGLVTEVAAVADTSSGVATFPVEVTVAGDPDAFYPGAIAEIEVVVSRRDGVIQVPAFAVTTTDGSSTVTVADGDTREERSVELGETSGTMVEITSGLSVGEQVVVTMPGRPGTGGTGGEDGADGEDEGGMPDALSGGGFPGAGGPGGATGVDAQEGEG